jgi:hypothetical protein
MNTPDTSLLRFGADLLWVFIAAVGGIARYLDAYLRTGTTPQIGLLIGHAAVSGFSGYMVAQTVIRFQPDWALVAAGVGGYLGTQGLDWAASVLKKRFGGDDKP